MQEGAARQRKRAKLLPVAPMMRTVHSMIALVAVVLVAVVVDVLLALHVGPQGLLQLSFSVGRELPLYSVPL